MTHEERFWAKVDKTGECWIWTGAPNGPDGYGRFWHGGKRTMAHRYAYELEHGPIPEGLTLDHLCRKTMCVRPSHLEPVTLGANVLRSDCPPAQNARKDVCRRGHPFDLFNTIQRSDGYRECRRCAHTHQRAHYLRAAIGQPVVVGAWDTKPALDVVTVCPFGDDEIVAIPLSELARVHEALMEIA